MAAGLSVVVGDLMHVKKPCYMLAGAVLLAVSMELERVIFGVSIFLAIGYGVGYGVMIGRSMEERHGR